jgi:hypothetical protein
MDVDLFMETPEGLSYFEDIDPNEECLRLKKTIYGTVQAARQWWKRFVKELEQKLGFKRSRADPCLLVKKTDNGIIVLCIYVDDACLLGPKDIVLEMKNAISRLFKVKDVGPLQEYVGVTVTKINDDELTISQPDIIQRLRRYFGRETGQMKEYKTPLPAHFHVIRAKEDETILSKTEMLKYRSGTGSLLYLVKHSRIDVANAVRELSKVMDKATIGHMKALLRCIRYVLLTEERKLHYRLTDRNDITVTAISDSDYAGDPESRKSISGFIVYVNGCPIAWRSRQQKPTSLSSCESEYYAMTEAATELIYIKQIFDFIGMEVKLPMTIRCDNQGAIFLAKNETSARTKHIDVRYHFIRDHVEDKTISIEYVNTKENTADALTKNLPGDQFEKLLSGLFKD